VRVWLGWGGCLLWLLTSASEEMDRFDSQYTRGLRANMDSLVNISPFCIPYTAASHTRGLQSNIDSLVNISPFCIPYSAHLIHGDCNRTYSLVNISPFCIPYSAASHTRGLRANIVNVCPFRWCPLHRGILCTGTASAVRVPYTAISHQICQCSVTHWGE
jgi:hypothetical protein